MDSLKGPCREKSFAPKFVSMQHSLWERMILAYKRPTKVRVSCCHRSLVVVLFLLGMRWVYRKRPLTVDRSVWSHEVSSTWWGRIVNQSFHEGDWLEKFRMSRGTFLYICAELKSLEKGDSAMRRAVPLENANGRLMGHWHCLLKRNDAAIEDVPTIISACCVLHNISGRGSI